MQGQPTHSGAGKEHRGWMGEVEGNEKEGEDCLHERLSQ